MNSKNRLSNEKGTVTIENLFFYVFIALVLVQGLFAAGNAAEYGFRRAAFCLGGGTDIITSTGPVNSCTTGIGWLDPGGSGSTTTGTGED